ncbi:MAG: 2OG-Fe(II) oxygenase [Vicinamibacterales bacterium]
MTRDLDWPALEASLDDRGYAVAGSPVLTRDECASMIQIYGDERRFRSRIDMARFRFGEGEYKYFANPLPPIVARLRRTLYPPLAVVANRWMERLGDEGRPFPPTLDGFLQRCAAHGQTKPTPLLLHYTAGGYNCLHQDVYGDVAFPLQAVVFLSEPGVEHEGGELLLVEQRPRAQSMGDIVPAQKGGLAIFTTRVRPVRGARGYYRVQMRHGVTRVHRGERFTLGIIFHDAR